MLHRVLPFARRPPPPPPDDGLIARDTIPSHLAALHAAQDGGGRLAVLAVRLARAGVADFDFDPHLEAAIRAAGIARIRTVLRRNDRIAVLAEDELAVLLPGLTSIEHAELAAARILHTIDEPLVVDGTAHALRAAVGVACSHPALGSPAQLVRDARIAARVASGKRARYHLQPPHNEGDTPAASIEQALRAALKQNAMTLHYQPQIALADGRPVAAEALARWTGPDGRPVSPALFVEVAERRGLLAQLTAWVVNCALREYDALRQAGHDLSIGINISPLDLEEDDFPDLLAQALATWSVPPDRITLEITETKPLRDPKSAVPILQRLKRVGVRLAVDDFGTGYSSLALLRQLPVDELKVDQQFVFGMLEAKASLDIVRSTLDLARNFGLDTVAEGIEDDATAQALREMGCRVGQGYVFARPRPMADLITWLDARRTPPRR